MSRAIQARILDCSQIIRSIEEIEFKLISHGLIEQRRITRLVKRALILKQTDYWNELDLIPTKKSKKKK